MIHDRSAPWAPSPIPPLQTRCSYHGFGMAIYVFFHNASARLRRLAAAAGSLSGGNFCRSVSTYFCCLRRFAAGADLLSPSALTSFFPQDRHLIKVFCICVFFQRLDEDNVFALCVLHELGACAER